MRRKKGAANNPGKPQRSDDANAFIPESAARKGADDDLAELLAENHQRGVIANEDVEEETQDVLHAEELGGPFVETTSATEFGRTMSAADDEPEDEPSSLPEAVGGLALASAEEESEEVEAREEQTGDIEPADAQGEVPSRIEPDVARLARTGRGANRPPER